MKKEKTLTWVLVVPILALFVWFFAIGIFKDLEISQALCSEKSIFATIFACADFLPISFLLTVSGSILIKYSLTKGNYSIVGKIFLIILGLGCVGFSIYYGINHLILYEFNNFLKYSTKLVAYIIVACVIIGSACFGVFFTNCDKSMALRFALTVAIAILVPVAIVNLGIKGLWGRPRYRILNDSQALLQYYRTVFEPAYLYGRAEEIPALAKYAELSIDHFKSFPSGHATDASSALLLFYIPTLNTKVNDKIAPKYICYGVGVVWLFTVMISRIVQGAHFVTDVTAGAFFAVLVIWVVSSIFMRKKSV